MVQDSSLTGWLLAWSEEDNELADLLDQTRTFFGEDNADTVGFMLKPGERTYLIARGVVLIEPRTAPGQFRGGSQGVSVRIAEGVSYRVGSPAHLARWWSSRGSRGEARWGFPRRRQRRQGGSWASAASTVRSLAAVIS